MRVYSNHWESNVAKIALQASEHASHKRLAFNGFALVIFSLNRNFFIRDILSLFPCYTVAQPFLTSFPYPFPFHYVRIKFHTHMGTMNLSTHRQHMESNPIVKKYWYLKKTPTHFRITHTYGLVVQLVLPVTRQHRMSSLTMKKTKMATTLYTNVQVLHPLVKWK